MMKARDIAKFSSLEYGQLASYARGLIIRDMDNGLLQNGRKKYSNKGSNIGWRTINVNGKKQAVYIDSYKNKKAKRFEPVRPKSLRGKPLNSYTQNVNMILTGETQRRIRPEGRNNRALLTFERGHIVEGNENRGYVIRDLSVRNRNKSVDFLQRIIDRKANNYMREPINIKIGK